MTVEETRTLAEVPGDRGRPIVGHTFDVLSGRLYNSRERYDRYGPVSWLRAFGRKQVSVIGPDGAAAVLQNRDRAFANGPGWGFLIGKFFPRGLMLLDFDEHHRHRRIMQQAFTADRLAGYLDPMNATLADGLRGAGSPTASSASIPRSRSSPSTSRRARSWAPSSAPEADRLNRAFAAACAAVRRCVRFPVPGLRWSRGLRGRAVLERYLRPRSPAKRAGDDNDLFTALCPGRAEDDGTASPTTTSSTT